MGQRQIKSDYLVVKSNSLICANYDLSIQEQKIILMLASLVKPEDKEFSAYEFKIKDFMKLVGITNKNSYREISAITKGLMKKVFEIRDVKKNTLLQIAWFSSSLYKFGEGTVILEFSPHLKPYLLQLKSLYTKYKLKNILSLKSKYSIRIYEILKCNAFKKQVTIPVDELKKMTGATSYKCNSDFRKRVIKPSQKEINQFTDLNFTYTEQKMGNKITSIKFLITDKLENIANIESEYDEDEVMIDIKNKIKSITKTNIKLSKVIELVELKGAETVYKYINNYKKFKVSKHNPVGFLIKAIMDEYPIPEEEINNYHQKPIQSTNFEQRVYDDDYFESLYDNLKD